jgi:rifampicin phosphotransferase
LNSTAESFIPPSPGAWELEQTHLTKPPSIYMAAVMPNAMMRGFKATTSHYGMLLDHLEAAVINRFLYYAARPVGAPKGAKGPPPKAVFKLMTYLHPEIRRRIRRSAEVFDRKLWREDLKVWDETVKPELTAEGVALLGEDLERPSNTELAAHVRRATAFLDKAIFFHHRFNGCPMIPTGDFLVRAMDWTGLSPSELLQPMRGLSPVSGGAQAEIDGLRPAIQADRTALTLLMSDTAPAEILAGLMDRPTAAGTATRAYVDAVGLRVLGGYDVADRHAREHPELLVKIIRTTVTGDDSSRRAAAEQGLEQLRSRVPAEHRVQFDALLAEAQLTYRIRDERVFYGDAFATGLARRAILAAGERLRVEGKAHAAEHLIDATPEEIVSLLENRGGPSPDELAQRSQWRIDTPISAAPANLGFAPSGPPPAEWLPGPAGHMTRVVSTVLSLLFDVKTDSPPPGKGPVKSLKGFAVSPGTYEGPARVITGVDQLAQVQQGEVLVASSTGPTFNVVLPLLGALVTERGGVLSHAAIVSREYGLPGVVGCVGAVKAITTGTRVRVDGGTGDVWILD